MAAGLGSSHCMAYLPRCHGDLLVALLGFGPAACEIDVDPLWAFDPGLAEGLMNPTRGRHQGFWVYCGRSDW